MRVADAVADWLAKKKIEYAFSIIGGGNVVLFDAIQAQGKIAVCCSHHEQAAAMSSCYFNRTRGLLASVVLCTTGAGSTNAITGVMAAHMDSIPLLVISGNEASKYMGQPTRVLGVQGYDSAGTAQHFTKWSNWASQQSMPILHQLELAYGHATDHRQGAVWVDICKDQQNAST